MPRWDTLICGLCGRSRVVRRGYRPPFCKTPRCASRRPQWRVARPDEITLDDEAFLRHARIARTPAPDPEDEA